MLKFKKRRSNFVKKSAKVKKTGHTTKVVGTSAGLKKTVSKSLLQVLNQEKTIVQEQAKLYQDWLNRLERETNRATKVNSKQETISTIVDQKLRLEQFLHERYPYLMASLSEEENRIRRDK
jgi:small-conductance mechanosensitive channel